MRAFGNRFIVPTLGLGVLAFLYAPILVIGTVGDPATPIAWADALAKQLTNGKLIRYNGQGHTGYNRGSACVDIAAPSALCFSRVAISADARRTTGAGTPASLACCT